MERADLLAANAQIFTAQGKALDKVASRDVKVAMHAAAMRAGNLSGLFGLLTFATGLVLIFYKGGFKVVPPTIHASMGLILVMIAIGSFFLRPAGKKIGAAIDQGDDAWRASLKPFSTMFAACNPRL
jgi:hypothetical protein